MTANTRLNADDEMVERMELDLITKARTAFGEAGILASIHGVFSLDDLEAKQESDLCEMIGIGVGYAGAEPTEGIPTPLNSAPGGPSAKTVFFLFGIILAVPHGPDCKERYSATKLLTILRRSLLGSIVSGDSTNRAWAFVKEAPNVAESTGTMLYYSQVWRLAMPITN